MLIVTEAAGKGLSDLLKTKGLDPKKFGLRLSVEKGGCAGLQYNLSVSPHQPDDQIVSIGAVSIFVAPDGAGYFEGCTLDYCEDLTSTGFKILNPKAVRSCGCGASFEPAR